MAPEVQGCGGSLSAALGRGAADSPTRVMDPTSRAPWLRKVAPRTLTKCRPPPRVTPSRAGLGSLPGLCQKRCSAPVPSPALALPRARPARGQLPTSPAWGLRVQLPDNLTANT